jgi:hypothetical protein
MKTHLIHLEHDDNVISITDKLSWGKARRILLVFPATPGLKIMKIDLLMIRRAAKKRGFSLGIVSRLNNVKLLAAEVGIPVFKSIKHAQSRTWAAFLPGRINYSERKTPGEIRKMGLEVKTIEPKWRTLIGVRLFFFSLGVLAVLLVSLLFIPSANIELNIPDHKHSITLNVIADELIDTVNLSGTIPVHTMNIDVEGSSLVSINSKTNVPDQFSVGKILFTNLTESQIEIPLGTIISRLDNTGIRFETIERGEISPGIGQTLTLPVRALTPGEAGNMEANSLGSLIGDLGTSVSAVNPEPSFGGTDRVTNFANETDRNELFGFLEKDLKIKAIQAAQLQLAEGDIIFPDSVIVEEILNEIYVPAAGQPGDRLSMDLRLLFTIQYASYSDLVRLSEPALKAGLPDGYVSLPGSSIKFDLLENPTTNTNGTTALTLQANQNIGRAVNGLYVSRLVQGLRVQESYKILVEEYGLEIRPVVKISPSWWPWLPIVTLRIAVTN